MTKRIIKIILVLFVLFLIVLGGVWLFGRQQAKKNGAAPLSFRAFLGLGTKINNANPAQGTLGSTFTPSDQPSSTGLGGTAVGTQGGFGQSGSIGGPNGANGTDNVQVSNFTNDTQSLTDNTTFNGTGNVGTGSGIGTGNLAGAGSGLSNSGTTSSSTGGNPTTGGATGSGLGGGQCTAADTAITFTPQEIQQLNVLQSEYNNIAADLATTTDVSAENANYSAYKIEQVKITELENFCQANTPLLTDPALKRHVPTPFWHDATQDNDVYTAAVVSTSANTADPTSARAFLERILRVNLW